LQFLRRIFLLGDIQCIPDQPHNFAILKHRFAGAVHCSLPVFRVINSILNVPLHALRKHFPDQRMDAITIDRAQDVKPFSKRRNTVSRIETEDGECFGRPIVKYAIPPERPASHVRQPFSLPQVKFASFQLARLFCNPLLSTFPVFDIDARPEPFHDVSVFITKRQLPM
jgi:hypothetical protein